MPMLISSSTILTYFAAITDINDDSMTACQSFETTRDGIYRET